MEVKKWSIGLFIERKGKLKKKKHLLITRYNKNCLTKAGEASGQAR